MHILKRYQRQIHVDVLSQEQQDLLSSSKVLVIGAGGVGTPAIIYLAAMGIGTLGILDYDKIELTNLNRQILYAADDVGEKKVEKAAEKIREFNPDITLNIYDMWLDEDNIDDIIKDYDVVIDAVDNIKSRYIISDACCKNSKVLVEGAAEGMWGHVLSIIPNKTPCYRCLYPESETNIAIEQDYKKGILGVVAGTIGCMLALEAMKLILSLGDNLGGKLLEFDGVSCIWREVEMKQHFSCSECKVKK